MVDRKSDEEKTTHAEFRRRIANLEDLPPKVDQLKYEIQNVGLAAERHIEKVLPNIVENSLKPVASKIENIEKTVDAIRLEQEIKSKIRAEDKAKAEEEELKREARRNRFWTRVAIFVPVMVALISLISATIISQQKPSQPPTQTERKNP